MIYLRFEKDSHCTASLVAARNSIKPAITVYGCFVTESGSLLIKTKLGMKDLFLRAD
jgi:hypothetical protein